MKDGYSIVYGGFATDKATGKEELLFETTYSELLCRERVEEKIHNRNLYTESDFDLDSIKIRYQKLETAINPWRDSEEEADLDSAIIRKDDCWFTEIWTKDDLINALDEIGISSDKKENQEEALNFVKSKKFMYCFDNQSEKNALLIDELSNYFYSKEKVTKRIVDYIIETGLKYTTTGKWCVYVDELKSKFDVTYKWLRENRNDIRDEINCRKEVLSAAWDVFDEKGIWYGFKCHFSDEYCPDYKGDRH